MVLGLPLLTLLSICPEVSRWGRKLFCTPHIFRAKEGFLLQGLGRGEGCSPKALWITALRWMCKLQISISPWGSWSLAFRPHW